MSNLATVSPHRLVGSSAVEDTRNRLIVSSWNVEGLTDITLHEMRAYMVLNSVDIVCIQESRKSKSDHFATCDGFAVFLSGRGDEEREFAGVGFVVAPSFRKFVIGCDPYSSRISSLKIRVTGGCGYIFSVYAPHNLHALDARSKFYEDLSASLKKTKSNGPRLLMGDFNARIGQRKPGEETILGEHCFGRETSAKVQIPNRDLLIEFCAEHGYMVGNTIQPGPDRDKATYHEIWAKPTDDISPTNFAMLDLLLLPERCADRLLRIRSDHSACIASHHFPITAIVETSIAHQPPQTRRYKPDWSALQSLQTRHTFSAEVAKLLEETTPRDVSESNSAEGVAATDDACVDREWERLCSCLLVAADRSIPKAQECRNKPWISDETLRLSKEKRAARLQGNWPLELRLWKQIRGASRRDKANWLQKLANDGDWKSLRKLRGGQRAQQTRLKNRLGDTVFTDERAESFVAHLESVQWRVRPATLVPGRESPINDLFPVRLGAFSRSEFVKAIQNLKSGKSVRAGDVPIECFKALVVGSPALLEPLLDFCNSCLTSGVYPTDWLTARVTMIFKKGDPSTSENYRPICLLCITYKIVAAMLKQRLLDAGVDCKLWPSQFGFRAGRSTLDGIFVVRRLIEAACAHRSGQSSILALDWQKAFDSIHVDSLLDALRRFGIPSGFIDTVAALLKSRKFFVSESGVDSLLRPQASGVSQGCTLSPLLFIIVMSVMMHDAVASLSPQARAAYQKGELADVTYADDTLLVGVAPKLVAEYLQAVAQAGKRYGLELHYGKFQLLGVRCDSGISTADGRRIDPSQSIGYLGTTLDSGGLVNSELSRRMGAAKADLHALARVWTRSSLSCRQKVRIFRALIEPKLLHGIAACAFNVRQQRQLNGFQARCLRQVLRIPSAYISRVSNMEVLRRANCRPLTELVTDTQMQLLGRSLRVAAMHNATFVRGTDQPLVSHFIRRRGRPRKEWAPTALDEARRRNRTTLALYHLAQDPKSWSSAMSTHHHVFS